MSSVDAMVAFLRDAHDEVERVALAAVKDQADNDEWTADSDEDAEGHFRRASVFTTGAYSTVADMGDPDGNEPTARHIALHDPRAALARAQAERALLGQLVEMNEGAMGRGEWGDPQVLHESDELIRTLAYGHRFTVPGYDPAWAPEGAEVPA